MNRYGSLLRFLRFARVHKDVKQEQAKKPPALNPIAQPRDNEEQSHSLTTRRPGHCRNQQAGQQERDYLYAPLCLLALPCHVHPLP
jgi:hypothetical protein